MNNNEYLNEIEADMSRFRTICEAAGFSARDAEILGGLWSYRDMRQKKSQASMTNRKSSNRETHFTEAETEKLLAHGLPFNAPFGHLRCQSTRVENLVVRSKTSISKAYNGIRVFQGINIYIASNGLEICNRKKHKLFPTLDQALCWLGAFSGEPLYLSGQEFLPNQYDRSGTGA